MTNLIRAALERLVFEINESGHWLAHTDAFTTAHAALAAAPEGEPSDQEIGDFIAYWWECFGKGYLPHSSDAPLVKAALARWGHPAAPLEGEVGELVAALRSPARWTQLTDAQADRAAALLQQFSAAAPAVVPVAVSERLPGEGDCDAEGRCWRFHPEDDYRWSAWYYSRSNGQETHWLPAQAIPHPAPQGGEVEA